MLDRLSAYCGAFSVNHPSLYKTAVRGGIGIGIAICGLAFLGAGASRSLVDWVGRMQPIPHRVIVARMAGVCGGIAGLGGISVVGAVGLYALVHTKEGKEAAAKAALEKRKKINFKPFMNDNYQMS